MNIRRATIFDADQIAQVHVHSRQAIYGGYLPNQFLDNLSQKKRSDEWRERLEQGIVVWIVENKETIFGFISTCPTRDVADDPNEVLEISAIYLLPKYWGKGFGTKLCRVVFDYAIQNKYKMITLWVLESNIQARNFYELLGFHTTGDIKIDHIGCEKLPVIKYKKNIYP